MHKLIKHAEKQKVSFPPQRARHVYSAQLHPIIDPVANLDKKWALGSVSWHAVSRWGEACECRDVRRQQAATRKARPEDAAENRASRRKHVGGAVA